MSALICSDKQFIETINGYLTHCKSNPRNSKLVEWANILKRENVRSVNHRYNERTKFEPVMFEPSKSTYSAWQTIHWLRCIDYQSCERPDYEKSDAYRLNMELQLNLFIVMNDSHFTNLRWTI